MINKLINKIQKTKAPIVVGLDPMLSYVPEHIQKKAFAEYGETLEGAAEAIWQFNKEIVDKTYDLIPAVKPQIAMYEQFGIEGLKAYKKTVDYWSQSAHYTDNYPYPPGKIPHPALIFHRRQCCMSCCTDSFQTR